jgi:DNA-binding NtrC family response regulator
MKSEFRILVVDDEKEILVLLEDLLSMEGYKVELASNAQEALQKYQKEEINVVISDIIMPEMSGLELLKKLKEINEDADVIMITGSTLIENAVEALKNGAEDYFTKPLSNIQILKVVERLYQNRKLEQRNEILKQELLRQEFTEMIGNTPKMKKIFSDINMVADSDIPVFISGESGTGKELVARAIHNLSSRKNEPFVPINCAAIPSDLLESEFFGHEKGAFSGATSRKYGLFEAAHCGTLLLDEIAEMPLALQAKILRAVETMQIRRIGGNQQLTIDVRIISSTNKDIKKEVESGKFRSDLYYRISTFTIHIPPVRERKADIKPIVKHILKLRGKEESIISDEILVALEAYSWPGNVRELENVLDRLLLITQDKPPTINQLLPEIRNTYRGSSKEKQENAKSNLVSLEEMEKDHIIRVLNHCYGNKRDAAKILGIGLKTLYRKIEQYHC